MKQGRITGSGKLYLEEKLLYEGQFKEEQFEGKVYHLDKNCPIRL